MKRLLPAAVFCLVAGCSGKQRQQPQQQPPNPVATQQDMEGLRNELRSLRHEVTELKVKTHRIESKYASASLDPTNKGYQRIDSTAGSFLVMVKSAQPYLDGYRVHLAIGNPSAARYDGFKLKLYWQHPMPEQKQGETDEQYEKRMEEWGKTEPHEKELSFTETLHPSSWNSVSFVVSPATAEEIKELEITEMQTDRVALIPR